ncbi:MAG: shikimate kinase [Oscillospiraceae bacterium]|jgi:shikimate kinase
MAQHIFLCGFMGCGKTTVGAEAARLAGTAFFDLDDEIIREAGMPIPEIFSRYGEERFREYETGALKRIAASSDAAIVATGGGALVSARNADICRSGGLVLLLDVPFETCYERIQGDKNRPNATGRSREELLALYEARLGSYRAHSDIVVPDNGLEQRAAAVAAYFK